MSDFKRISLWSGPRNISTTLMYSFAQRADTVVFDEPLYGYYLANSEARNYHPGSEETMASMDCSAKNVIEMMQGPQSRPIAFFKNMTHHLLDLDKDFMKNLHNLILTRDPREMLPSIAKVIKNPTMADVGYAQHIDLIDYFDSEGIKYAVLDSKNILLDPKSTLIKLCEHLDIPFDENMLHWEKGARPEDGSWAKYWYHNVHNSTGYNEYKAKVEEFPKNIEPLLEECRPYYKRLLEMAL